MYGLIKGVYIDKATFGSCRSQIFFKIDVLKNFAMFTEKIAVLESFLQGIISTYFWPIFPFYIPPKHQKSFMLSGRIEWEHWPEMG